MFRLSVLFSFVCSSTMSPFISCCYSFLCRWSCHLSIDWPPNSSTGSHLNICSVQLLAQPSIKAVILSECALSLADLQVVDTLHCYTLTPATPFNTEGSHSLSFFPSQQCYFELINKLTTAIVVMTLNNDYRCWLTCQHWATFPVSTLMSFSFFSFTVHCHCSSTNWFAEHTSFSYCSPAHLVAHTQWMASCMTTGFLGELTPFFKCAVIL